FITHCGMNSASEGLYFEVPLVLFPQTPEQGAVATRVEELGAGIILKSIEKEEILNVINEVLDNPKYKEKALKISESFKDCGGVKEARIFLETIVG
ncbi:MAG: glucosyltransferase, partial [Tissierellia bacterium]|nr:glucosyltransferase [Tissierellia bacterium]